MNEQFPKGFEWRVERDEKFVCLHVGSVVTFMQPDDARRIARALQSAAERIEPAWPPKGLEIVP